MRRWGIAAALLMVLLLAGATACNPFGGDEEEVGQRLVEVVRGDLAVTVSGSGNIEVTEETSVTFRVGGRIEKLFINEGDNVAKGDVLARLDTTDLEMALTQSRVTLTQTETALTQAEVAITQAELTVSSANVSLRTARHSLDEARDLYTWPEIKVAQSEVDDWKAFLQHVIDTGADIWYAQARLDAAEAILDAMTSDYDTEEVAIKKMEVTVAEQTLALRQQSLKHARQSREYTRQLVDQARQSLEHAQKQLNDATITALFDGLVASVPVDERDTVSTVTTIVHLIDPTTMELKVQVDEIDIPEVKPGQRVIIEVDALPALALEGRIKSISLLSTSAGGVIVYEVNISFDVPEGLDLRNGMSADADIVITERNNILLVPDRAIKHDSEGNTVVEVVVDEQVEERTVVIGISDGFETEILDGLEEGEMIERRVKPK